jgi:hypothetical protein
MSQHPVCWIIDAIDLCNLSSPYSGTATFKTLAAVLMILKVHTYTCPFSNAWIYVVMGMKIHSLYHLMFQCAPQSVLLFSNETENANNGIVRR